MRNLQGTTVSVPAEEREDGLVCYWFIELFFLVAVLTEGIRVSLPHLRHVISMSTAGWKTSDFVVV